MASNSLFQACSKPESGLRNCWCVSPHNVSSFTRVTNEKSSDLQSLGWCGGFSMTLTPQWRAMGRHWDTVCVCVRVSGCACLPAGWRTLMFFAHRHMTPCADSRLQARQKHRHSPGGVFFFTLLVAGSLWRFAPSTLILRQIFFSFFNFFFPSLPHIFWGGGGGGGVLREPTFIIEMKIAGEVAPARGCLCRQIEVLSASLFPSEWVKLTCHSMFPHFHPSVTASLPRPRSPRPRCSYVSVYWQLVKTGLVFALWGSVRLCLWEGGNRKTERRVKPGPVYEKIMLFLLIFF